MSYSKHKQCRIISTAQDKDRVCDFHKVKVLQPSLRKYQTSNSYGVNKAVVNRTPPTPDCYFLFIFYLPAELGKDT